MIKACISDVAYHLPETLVSNEQLAGQFPDWPAAKIEQKTGIRERYIAGADECASDLAVHAAEKLFAAHPDARRQVDYLLLCTQSPDYFLPTTACLLQGRLRLSTACGALDFNLGCSGYVYGLGLAKGLIETGQARTVLLLTAETYSKFMHPDDKSVRTLFGDAAAATLVVGREMESDAIGPFVYGTDGSGGDDLIVAAGGLRQREARSSQPAGETPTGPTEAHLSMNGPAIFAFTLKAVPAAVEALLERSGLGREQVDLFVFHQANLYMLEFLRKKLNIPVEKFPVHIRNCGNTVSSTIPIVLAECQRAGQLKPGMRVMVVGFGVGLSWGAAILHY
jgi:3-oxoacyl-[acyl-carrier-protein] synthase III